MLSLHRSQSIETGMVNEPVRTPFTHRHRPRTCPHTDLRPVRTPTRDPSCRPYSYRRPICQPTHLHADTSACRPIRTLTHSHADLFARRPIGSSSLTRSHADLITAQQNDLTRSDLPAGASAPGDQICMPSDLHADSQSARRPIYLHADPSARRSICTATDQHAERSALRRPICTPSDLHASP